MPVVIPDPQSPEFDSPDLAAHALADSFRSSGNERAGVLFKKPNGKYVYSQSVPGGQDHFELRVGLPKGHVLAGIVHTHPTDDPQSQVFSPDDINVANSLKVPSYVRFLHDNSTRMYAPGKTKTQPMTIPGSRMPLTVAKGDVVLPPQPVQPIQAAASSPLDVADQPPAAVSSPPFAAFAASTPPQS